MRRGPRSDDRSRASYGAGTGQRVASQPTLLRGLCSADYAENELPQPQPPVEFGFLNVKPEPCINDT